MAVTERLVLPTRRDAQLRRLVQLPQGASQKAACRLATLVSQGLYVEWVYPVAPR